MGGEIRGVDPVRDQFTLKVFGGRPVKIVFDERTQIYRNGARIPVFDLHSDDHASVETALDGTTVFALRIHLLSQLPENEYRGQVSSYNQQTGELTINAASSREPMTLLVPAGTPVVRVGQDGSSVQERGPADFVHGSLVDVRFTGGSGSGSHGVVTNVDVLAVPGSAFIFSGNLSFLDLHSGRLVIVDPRDNQAYPIVFDPSLVPAIRKLHEGLTVKVTTNFDGVQYIATEIKVE